MSVIWSNRGGCDEFAGHGLPHIADAEIACVHGDILVPLSSRPRRGGLAGQMAAGGVVYHFCGHLVWDRWYSWNRRYRDALALAGSA